MNTIQKLFAGIAVTALLASAAPAFAQNIVPPPPTAATVNVSADASAGTANVTVSTKLEARITTGKSRADQEIDRRVTMLNDLNTQVQAMVKVSAAEKTAISDEVSSEVSNLTSLKTKIDADTDIATLKTDIQSITASYRIFMLVIPQGRIEVAADKIATAASSLGALAGKLQTRITSAQASGSDVTSLSASLTDMNAKLADANVQATAAVSHVSSLTPDNGDKTKMAANNAALKLARADIKVGLQDLQDARKDAGTIVTGLKNLNASTTTSASTSVQ
jgi:hypothetical protein